MAVIPGGIPFAGLVSPTDSSDTYAVTDETYNRGGFRTVSNLLARNAITTDRQLQGMLVYVQSENKTYQLSGIVGSNSWVEYKSSGNVTAETLPGVSLNSTVATASGLTSIGASGNNLVIQSDKTSVQSLNIHALSGILKSVSGDVVQALAGIDYLRPDGNGSQLSGITPSQVGLGHVTNDTQVKKSEYSISGNIVSWVNNTGDALEDTGISKQSVHDAVSKTHEHSNKVLLDSIDQSLNSGSGVVFANVKSDSLSVDRVLVSNNDKVIESSSITREELGSLSGVASNIQSQINSKQDALAFGNVESGSSRLSVLGQKDNAVIGSGIILDVSELNINHNNLSGLTSGNPHTQYQLVSEKAQALGYASLDGGGKVPLSQLPSTLLQYEGQWNALTNNPVLIDPDLTKVSSVYEVSASGTRFGFDWMIGDWLVYNASGQVERSINSNIVASVFGRTGAITAQVNDYNKSQISGLTDTSDVTFSSEILSNLNPNTVIYADASKKIQSSIITKSQLDYLSGVTSDVQSQINSKVNSNVAISSGTYTKITFDSKGLIISGVSATTADINDSIDRRYITDAQRGVLQNTSGVNTGDETNTSIKSKLGASTSSNDGYLTQNDWTTFNNKSSIDDAMAFSIALG